MLSNNFILFLTSILLLIFPTEMLSKVFSCPEYIMQETTLKKNYENWQVIKSKLPVYFKTLSVISGALEDMAVLVPDQEATNSIVWNLQKDQKYWVVCYYLSSDINLVQQLPESARTCSVSVKKVGTRATQLDSQLICSTTWP